ncbi:MAG TPA: hypothetical protein VFX60_05165 [Micromonospora sp.]|nr:hypothetical protein [Micromonospora sp.]
MRSRGGAELSCTVFNKSRKLLAVLLAALLLGTGCGGPADGSQSASWAGDAGTPPPGSSEGLGSVESDADVQPTAETTPTSPTPQATKLPASPQPTLTPTARRTTSPQPPPSHTTAPPAPPAQQPSPGTLCGSGYHVINSHSLPGATTYVLYKNDGGYNCVVTIKTANVGTATRTGAWLETQDGRTAKDEGDFKYYAGPVRLPAPKTCIKWGGRSGGTSWTSNWAHCG